MEDKVRSTIARVDRVLRQQRNALTADPDFELGDDPEGVKALLCCLEDTLRQLKKELGGAYTLENKGLEEVNPYFNVCREMDHTIRFVRNIKRGSDDTTDITVSLLDRCLRHLATLAEKANVRLFPHETALMILERHLDKLKPDHPARAYFEDLRSKLEEAWHKQAGRDALYRILSDIDDISLSLSGLKFRQLEHQYPPASEGDTPVLPPISPSTPIEKYWAIIVGVSNHQDQDTYGQLPYAANDACQLARVLLSTKHGYAVERIKLFVDPESVAESCCLPVLQRPPEWDVVLSAVESFSGLAGPQDLLLFYFSGHGVLWNGRPYLVCQDTVENRIQRTGLPMSEVKMEIQNSNARVKVIVLDTCHAGAILGHTKAVDPMQKDYIRRVFEAAEGTIIMTACEAGQRSFPFDDDLSVFTHYLVEGLEEGAPKGKNFVTADDLKRYIVNGVLWWSSKSGKPQTPVFGGENLTGDPIIADWRSTEEVSI